MEIIENVYQLDCASHGHVFFIRSDEGILIDTGMPGLVEKILAELEALDGAVQTIKKILLTHHDIDHIGNAKALQDATQAEVWAPQEDVPYIMGEKNRPGIKRILQTISRPPKPHISGCYLVNQNFGEVRVIHAPGHTPGHTIFQYRNVVFIGDLFQEIKGRLDLLPRFFIWDQEEAKRSISIIKELQYDWICPSHGMPIKRGTVTENFLKNF
ncbi:MBL fold metallo-hydrolase [Acetobacterium sp.]|jgi:glyoxylase-like metal-dependent hydrolase (beta-lactamase superfamily II)|uniref:MBL fold metallo-hydrolase n=1 Tax=Acetobacterium sp. TaxID=1872094 RepID=UPI000CAB4B82|nr:MBL fold metallo-hydrolase [Acetobacterium sp.]MDO9493944.1 MBL fold metallo-hydrolase [Acetobacterium sp.]PKM73068.1 MAG: MBL fold metallo-hydrolase [Firmicutes bacterium HGW-Firmicutes-17]